MARGWQGERVALTGVVLRQRRVKVPEPALRVPRAVLADPVRLVDGWAHDRGAGSDAAGVMGVRVVHRDHGHAGNRAEAAWEPVAVGGRVQPYHMAAGADLAVHDRAAVIASERARRQAEDPDQVRADGCACAAKAPRSS